MTKISRRWTSLALALALTGTAALVAQSGNSDSRKSAVTAILVDVVVRDKAGNPVADLRQDEFELVEDGQKQAVGSFTPIFKGPASEENDAAPASAPVASRAIAQVGTAA